MNKNKRLGIMAVAIYGVLLFGWNWFNYQKVVNTMPSTKQIKESWGLSREEFNYSYGVASDESVIKIVDGLLNGELTVSKEIESQQYDLQELDWNMQSF